MQDAVAVQRAVRVESEMLFAGQNFKRVCQGGGMQFAAARQPCRAVAIHREAKVADLGESVRQDVQHEAPEELDRVEAYLADLIAALGVTYAEADVSVFE